MEINQSTNSITQSTEIPNEACAHVDQTENSSNLLNSSLISEKMEQTEQTPSEEPIAKKEKKIKSASPKSGTNGNHISYKEDFSAKLTTAELCEIFNISPQRVSKIATDLGVITDEHSYITGRNRIYRQFAVRKIIESRGFKYDKKIILVNSLKGGTGKTTLSLGAAYRLACLGARVLLIDLDKQGNATITIHNDPVKHTFLHLVTGEAKVEDTIVKTRYGFDLIPATLANSRLEVEFSSRKVNQRRYFRGILGDKLNDYDYVIIDSPPDLSHSIYLATLAADILVVPINLDRYSMEGLSMNLKSVSDMAKNFSQDGFNLRVMAIINKYDAREKTALDFLSQLRTFKDLEVMTTVVRIDSNFKKSQKIGTPLMTDGKKTSALEDIDSFAQELIGLDQIKKEPLQ